MVFSINMMLTELKFSVCTVKMPRILLRRELPFFLRCSEYAGIRLLMRLSSTVVIVLTMNLESWLKKKKEPEEPAL